MKRHVIMPVYYFKQLLNGAEIRNKSEHNRKENHKKSNRIDQHSLQKDERSSSERHEAQGNNIFNDSSYVNTKIKKSNYVLDLTKANDSILPKSAINEQSVCTLGERKNIVNVKHYGSGDNESTEKDKNMCLTGKKIWRERLWKRINFRRMSLKSVKSKRKADIFTKNLSLSEKNTLIAKGGILTELKSEIPILKDYLVLHSNCESINTNQNYSSISLRKDVVYCKPSIRENQDIQQNSKRNEIHKCINCPVIIFPEIEDEMQKNLLNSCLQLIEYLASKLCRSGDNRPISDCNKKSLICDKIHVVKSKYIDALTKVKDKCTQQSDYLRMINETFLKMENDVSYNETNCQTMEWNIERAKSNKKQVHQCEQVSKTLINIYDKRRRALPPNAAETIKEKQFIGNLVEKNLKHNKANTEEWQHDDYKCRKADSFECSANACKACGDINEPKVQSNNVRINSYDCLTSHFDCECMNAKIIKSNLIPTLSKDFKQTLFSGKNVKKNLANSNKCLKLHDVCRCTNDEAFIKHTKITDTCNDFNQQKVANTLKNNSYKCFKSLDDCNRINDEVIKSSKRSRICKNIKLKVFGNHIKKNRKDNKAYTKECSKLQDDCRCINVKPFQSTKIFNDCENLNHQKALDNFLKINANHWFKSHIDCEYTNNAINESSKVSEQKQDFSKPVLKNCTDTKANIKCLKLRNDCKCKNAKIIESNEISSTSKNLTKKQFLGCNERLKTHCDSICQKVVGLQFKKVANGYRGSNLNPIRSGLKSKNVKKNTNEYFKYLNDCKCLNDGMIETCKLCRTRKSIGKKVFVNNVKKNRRHNETTNECSKLQNECRCINTDVSEACGDVNLRQVGVNHFQKNSRKYLKSDNNCKCIHSGKIESSNLPTICKDIKQIDDVDKNVQKNVDGKRKRWLHCNFRLRHRPKRKSNVIHCKAKYTDSGSKRDAGTLESSTHKKKYRKKTKKHVRMRLHSDTFLQLFFTRSIFTYNSIRRADTVTP
ncbi:jg7509 [Pararge aegeria aegeria]|uniref:Jg7509 protein n=1 Tax=Pararge aegeria aegeria TaxID=348720 RepID=A0A8S4RE15_9NEOP|nr:jg7509 [Pararge aegeria aegeria]